MKTAIQQLDYVHTGPETLAGRYLRTFWQPVYRAADLPAGQAVPIQIMSERFTLYRGASPQGGGEGRPHLVDLRCAHRGTQLAIGWVEDDCIRCRYHGWMYDGSGQCVEQPGEDPAFAARVQIRTFPVQDYVGLIFAYLGEGEPPPLPRYPEFEDEGVLDVYPPEYWPCNYFNRIDNAPDLGHVHFAHRDSREAAGTTTGIGRVFAQETDYGVMTGMEIPGRQSSTVHYHMPNINQFVSRSDLKLRDPLSASAQGKMSRLLIRVPVDDEHCVSFPIDHVSLTGEAGERYLARRRGMEEAQLAASLSPEGMGERILASQMTHAEVRERDPANLKTLTSVEDYVVQCGQGPIADHASERLGRMDAGITLIRAIWQRELRAFAEGRPRKQWLRTERLPA